MKLLNLAKECQRQCHNHALNKKQQNTPHCRLFKEKLHFTPSYLDVTIYQGPSC